MGKINQMLYRLVLVSDAHKWEDDGWRIVTGRIATKLGGARWASVWMVRAI